MYLLALGLSVAGRVLIPEQHAACLPRILQWHGTVTTIKINIGISNSRFAVYLLVIYR